ncbi:senescence/dehydration-associated protein At3g51250-like [Carex rostrata]
MLNLIENLPAPHEVLELLEQDLPPPTHQVLLQIPGGILHLINANHSIELASGELTIVRLLQGDNQLAVLASVGPDVQWPLTPDGAAVKLDASCYFFTIRIPPSDAEAGGPSEMLNYGLTLASKGQETLLNQLDEILQAYCIIPVQKAVVTETAEVLNNCALKSMLERIIAAEPEKVVLEKKAAAYWTTRAPNVDYYSGSVRKAIASGEEVKGILWCGDVTAERLKRGNEYFIRRMIVSESKAEVSPETLKRIERVKRVTKISEEVATGILSGVVMISGYVTGSIANPITGRKISSLLPGDIVLASLKGFGKICDALSPSSTATIGLVPHRYGGKAAQATNEGLDVAGHEIGVAWAVFKIRRELAKTAAKSRRHRRRNKGHKAEVKNLG